MSESTDTPTVTYTTTIKSLGNSDSLSGYSEQTVSEFELREGYNIGWTANVIVSFEFGIYYPTTGNIFNKVARGGLNPGATVILKLSPTGAVPPREWLAVVDQIDPIEPGTGDTSTIGKCNIHLIDPITHLANRPIWGAYRACSVGNMIGGALSMAAGGDGKPTLNAVLTGLPTVYVVEDFTIGAEFLNQIPYAIATGQTLGQWLGDIVNELALRAELVSNSKDNSVTLSLTDKVPDSAPLAMAALSANVAENSSEAAAGRLFVAAIVGHAGTKQRDTEIVSIGAARSFGALGSIGRTLTGPEITIDEAARRVDASLEGVYTEMLQVLAISRQPGLHPGNLIDVALARGDFAVQQWQVSDVHHFYISGTYDNEVKLLRGDTAWRPAPPKRRSPVFVSGVLDNGGGQVTKSPVERDTVGRVFVRFPFSPTASYEEQLISSMSDTDEDGVVILSDFTEKQKQNYSDREVAWEQELSKYENGNYDLTTFQYEGYVAVDDAISDALDEDKTLTRDAVENDLRRSIYKNKDVDERFSVAEIAAYRTSKEKIKKRNNVLMYKGYKEAKVLDAQDADKDSYLSDRDQLVSDDLEATLGDEDKRNSLVTKWEEIKETRGEEFKTNKALETEKQNLNEIINNEDSTEDEKTAAQTSLEEILAKEEQNEEDNPPPTAEALETKKQKFNEVINNENSTEEEKIAAQTSLEEILAKEYGVIFDEDYGLYFGVENADAAAAIKDAELETQRWPPRIPLTVIEPMAGKHHGFITSHRQGNICRVAVHNPLWAEIVGFQYRATQVINPYLIESEAGMLIEHQADPSRWSGIVFNRIASQRERTVRLGASANYTREGESDNNYVKNQREDQEDQKKWY